MNDLASNADLLYTLSVRRKVSAPSRKIGRVLDGPKMAIVMFRSVSSEYAHQLSAPGHLEEGLYPVTAPKDPFVDSIGPVSRQNSLPFWLDRSWIPAESEYPTDDEDGRGLFGIRHSTPQVLVYDWAQKALDIKPLDTYKYPNSSEGTKRVLHASYLGLRVETSTSSQSIIDSEHTCHSY